MILGSGLAPVAELRAAGAPVGLGVRRVGLRGLRLAVAGGPDRDAAGQAAARRGVDVGRDALEIATRGGAACSGGPVRSASSRWARAATSRSGRSRVAFAGALSDPVEAWLRCGPVAARHTVVAGRLVVEDGVPVHPGLDELLAGHRRASAAMQAASRPARSGTIRRRVDWSRSCRTGAVARPGMIAADDVGVHLTRQVGLAGEGRIDRERRKTRR